MLNKQKPGSRTKRKPFEYTKKFRKAISNIDKLLKPGVLVKTRHFGVVLIYIRRSITKKVWHRKYFFLGAGKLLEYKRQDLYLLEVLNEQ